MIKVNESEARYIQVLHSVGLPKVEIAEEFKYKYMDVINVLRGNAFSNVTGILNRNITEKELVIVEHLLNQGHSYRAIAKFSGIDANKVRNIKGYLHYQTKFGYPLEIRV